MELLWCALLVVVALVLLRIAWVLILGGWSEGSKFKKKWKKTKRGTKKGWKKTKKSSGRGWKKLKGAKKGGPVSYLKKGNIKSITADDIRIIKARANVEKVGQNYEYVPRKWSFNNETWDIYNNCPLTQENTDFAILQETSSGDGKKKSNLKTVGFYYCILKDLSMSNNSNLKNYISTEEVKYRGNNILLFKNPKESIKQVDRVMKAMAAYKRLNPTNSNPYANLWYSFGNIQPKDVKGINAILYSM